MKINEIFYSIQGEGKWAGTPNIFIRTSGCNLRCTYCDTKNAYYNGSEIKIADIIKEISKYKCKKVCLTGGEPLLQKDLNKIIKQLIKEKYSILIETNGSINLEKINELSKVIISLDIKCPSSKMNDKMFFHNINLISKKDQLKFVINSKDDYIYAKKIIEEYKPNTNIYFQPAWGFAVEKLVDWMLNDNLDIKLGLQLHKIIGNIK